MSEFIFNSAKVISQEKDLSFNTPAVQGLTALGLVGETMKGPAFEPIAVSSKSAFRALFGGKSPEKFGRNYKYLLPYYADSYLEEGNQLYVVRVLGKSGYNAGKAWAVTIAATAGNSFADNMVVAVLRSRANYDILDPTLLDFRVNDIAVVGLGAGVGTGSADPFAARISYTRQDSFVTENLLVSLDPNSPDFITKILGTDPKDGNTGLYVDVVFTDMMNVIIGQNYASGVNGVILTKANGTHQVQFQSPETPYIVSELRGNTVMPLYKFICISDGDSANQEIKISHENIDPITKEFDVVIRDFNDTDDNTIILERFGKCTMNPKSTGFIGRRIGSRSAGALEADYELKSNYVFLEMAANAPDDAYPSGFQGYTQPELRHNDNNALMATPKMFFKTSYSSTDRVNRTYLGMSERGYDTSSGKGRSICPDFFNFRGDIDPTRLVQMNGFHMDSGATGNYLSVGKFDVGAGGFRTLGDLAATAVYGDRSTRKFTFAPVGGFDGWDLFRDGRTNTDSFRTGSPFVTPALIGLMDYDAYFEAIAKFGNSEQTDISLIATPGLNWAEHLGLVRETIDLVENVRRGDCLYVVDAPDYDNVDGVVEDVAKRFDDADLDTSYATTYYPSIQIEDTDNNTLVYIPATGEVLRAMAYTDKVKFPWWAPAGHSRGLIKKAKRTRRKLKESERDTLYEGRINPIADFSEVGVDIFGQKTMQRAESALDRISVRRMLIYAKDIINKISRTLIFEQNDDVVESQFLTKVNPILETIKRERGIERFSVAATEENTPETRSRHQLFFRLRCLPIGALEEIGITFEVSPAGTQFNN